MEQRSSNTSAFRRFENLQLSMLSVYTSPWGDPNDHVRLVAGKPIFTLHGDCNSLAGFMAVIHAMISFTAEGGDTLSSTRCAMQLSCCELLNGNLATADC